jgi:uncharacterized protein YdeI (YjbR/CyaY-like superfamily)
MDVNSDKVKCFPTPKKFRDWLKANHAKENEVWLKLFKKGSDTPSITWEESVMEAIAWGWIDGLKKSHDEKAYFQRFTPRTKTSGWSKTNRDHAENLIKGGRMQRPGMKEVDAAKSDGRWESAYAGPSKMEIPKDFLDALAGNKKAEKFFKTLNRTNLYSIYHRLHTAKKPETRQNRMDKIIEMLARGEKFH